MVFLLQYPVLAGASKGIVWELQNISEYPISGFYCIGQVFAISKRSRKIETRNFSFIYSKVEKRSFSDKQSKNGKKHGREVVHEAAYPGQD
jgi:hypothetical protein